jgi:hypothetical protein
MKHLRCGICGHDAEEGSIWTAENGTDVSICRHGCEVRRSTARLEILVLDGHVYQRFVKKAPAIVPTPMKTKAAVVAAARKG